MFVRSWHRSQKTWVRNPDAAYSYYAQMAILRNTSESARVTQSLPATGIIGLLLAFRHFNRVNFQVGWRDTMARLLGWMISSLE